MEKLKTPVGVVKFPSIGTPNKKGKYEISLVFDPKSEAYQDFSEKLNEATKEYGKAFREKPLVKPDIIIEDGDKKESGLVIMKFTSGFEPVRFDARGQKTDAEIEWGSKCIVAFNLKEYDVDGQKGLAKYIRGIQIIELKESGATAESCGFEPQEGYVAETQSETSNLDAVDPDQIKWDE